MDLRLWLLKCRIPLIAATLFSLNAGAALLPPRPSGPVADFARVVDQETRLKISSVARNLWVDKKIGLMVATIDITGETALEPYAQTLFKEWGIGDRSGHISVLVVVRREPAEVCILYSDAANIHGEPPNTSRFSTLSGVADIQEGRFSDGLLVLAAELRRNLQSGEQLSSTQSSLGLQSFELTAMRTVSAVAIASLFVIVVLLFLRLRLQRKKAVVSRYGSRAFPCSCTRGAFLSGTLYR